MADAVSFREFNGPSLSYAIYVIGKWEITNYKYHISIPGEGGIQLTSDDDGCIFGKLDKCDSIKGKLCDPILLLSFALHSLGYLPIQHY